MHKSFTAIKLHFETPLHLSRGKSDYETGEDMLHSDTIKSAVFACGLQLYGEKNINKSFLESFKVTSAYPFYRDEFFFPKPMTRLPLEFPDIGEAIGAKKIKKLKFLGKSFFETVLKGKKRSVEDKHLIQKGRFISDRLQDQEFTVIQTEETQQRVTVPHEHETDQNGIPLTPTPFYLQRLHFSRQAGLFFLTDATDETLIRLDHILKLLGDNGIGTDRNVGNGFFTHEIIEHFTLEIPETTSHQISLSLYLPRKEELSELLLSDSSYMLIKRGGYIASAALSKHMTFRKKSIYMFSEGSTFPNGQLEGKIEDLQPDIFQTSEKQGHPVWRDGMPIWVPIKITQLTDTGS